MDATTDALGASPAPRLAALAGALVAFPPGLAVAEPADEPGGPPKRFERITRIPERSGLLYAGTRVMLEASDNTTMAAQFPQFDIAELSVLLQVPTLMEALAVTRPVLEALLDSLSFQMQTALHVVSLEIIDVTPPVRPGDERAWQAYAPADTAVSPKFGQMPPVMDWREVRADTPTLGGGPLPEDSKERMALWWYIKGLDASYAVDRYVCFWTSLEILWSLSDVTVDAAYIAPCGHVVESCPECGRSLSRTVLGASMRSFLTERAGVEASDASQLWNLRQVVHGKNVFDPQQLDLGRLTSVLRAAVLQLLKAASGPPQYDPPLLVKVGGLTMGNPVVLSGSRLLNDRDVANVDFLLTLTD